MAAAIDPALTPEPPPSTPIPDPDPATTDYVASMLAKASAGNLELADFAAVRQTLFPRIQAALAAALRDVDAPDRMDLLHRETVGDDTVLEYWAWFGERRFRAWASVAAQGGLTALRVREEPE